MDDGRKKLIGLVERLGLFETLKLTDMPYVKLWSLIGDSWLTTDIIINFIKDLLSAYNPGGLTINDISDNTITYSETSDGVMEIDYLTPTVVYVVEFNIIGNILGHIKKTYEELSQDVLFEIFDLLTTYHDDRRNIKLQEQIRKVLREEINESNFLYKAKDLIGRLLLKDKYNAKPSLSFDREFGTEISQKYNYPFGLSENKIWRVIDNCSDGSEKNCILVKKIVDKLGDYFPYPDYSNLPFRKKVDILQGMVSNFNYDDIVSFSIEGKTGENNELEDEVDKLQNKLNYIFRWVPSKQTIDKIKKSMNLQEQISRIQSMMGVINENIPQPGESSGSPLSDEERQGMESRTEELTVNELIDMLDYVPYYKEVLQDVQNDDYSWGVTEKVMEYAKYLKQNPDSVYNLPPIIIVNGKLQDGAHRISALYLLQNNLDMDNPLWSEVKLNVEFYS